MANNMQGAWTVSVQSKSAAFPQRFLIEGAASGNGRAICMTFARHGANVIVADIREDPREGGQPTHELVSESTAALPSAWPTPPPPPTN